MKLTDLRELVSLRPLELNPERRRLNACLTVHDVAHEARRRLPRAVADYVDGGADDQLSLSENNKSFRAWSFLPRTLVDVEHPNLSTTIFGKHISAPIGLAPTGYTRMIDPQGESTVAAAAEDAAIPYVLSTMASTSLEDVRSAVPLAHLWFQLYVWKDRGMVRELLHRAASQGYSALEIAVDTPVSGMRLRDARNGFTIPPRLTLKSLGGVARKPRYWMRMLTAPKLQFANVSATENREHSNFTIDSITNQFDPSLTWADLDTIREQWDGPILLKGPVGPAAAEQARRIGIDGIHLSNHGGRQLDRSIAPVELIHPVRTAVGNDMTITVDSGIRHGADVVTALALGADAAFFGRPYIWGLVAGGKVGVSRVVTIIREELRRTMQLLGVTSIEELRQHGHELLVRNASTWPPSIDISENIRKSQQ